MTFRNGGGSEDPRALLRFMRNALIGIIALVAFRRPRRHVQRRWQADPAHAHPYLHLSHNEQAHHQQSHYQYFRHLRSTHRSGSARCPECPRLHREAVPPQSRPGRRISLTGYVADGDVATVAEEISQSGGPPIPGLVQRAMAMSRDPRSCSTRKYIVGLFPTAPTRPA